MGRIKLKKYTLGEELVSSISHGVGSLLSIVATVFGVIKTVQTNNILGLVCVLIFCLSMFNMYAMSTMYHALARNTGKKVFRVLDHCAIFLLIAGTYTPYALISLGGITGIVILSIVWVSAIVGIVLNAVNMEKFKVFSMICYLLMGWVVIFAAPSLIKGLELGGLILLLSGGILYTIGAIIYGIGSKVKYMHSVWHFFVLFGSILHYLSVYFYVL